MRRTAVLLGALVLLATDLESAPMLGSGPGYGQSWGMMGGWWNSPPLSSAKTLTIDQAAEAVSVYLKSYGNHDLILAEVMEFDNHFYAEVEEKSTGVHAFELLVNRWTGAIAPEPGPNMMWNTKYGHRGAGMMRGGMMGGRGWGWGGSRGFRTWPAPDREMTVTPQKARQHAQEFLDARLPGTKVEDTADTFYGYYTIHVLKDGQVYGMLGVNGYSGWVWYHEWHGEFVRMKEDRT